MSGAFPLNRRGSSLTRNSYVVEDIVEHSWLDDVCQQQNRVHFTSRKLTRNP